MADRLEVLKTYKTYVGGKFPRSESDRTFKVTNSDGEHIANSCRCTRKDVRDAVVAARSAFNDWKNRSAYNRGQILYRIAEILEGRKEQFVKELELLGVKKKQAVKDIELSIDRLIYFAGWTDKYTQVYGTINPVASSHFNFSMPEPTGIVAINSPDDVSLLSLVSLISPVIAGGNVCVVLSSEKNPLSAVSFGEVLHASDVPGGVINILTGYKEEVIEHIGSHKDINAILNTSGDQNIKKLLDENASISVKRVVHYNSDKWESPKHENPYLIIDFQETKTTWHPVGM